MPNYQKMYAAVRRGLDAVDLIERGRASKRRPCCVKRSVLFSNKDVKRSEADLCRRRLEGILCVLQGDNEDGNRERL